MKLFFADFQKKNRGVLESQKISGLQQKKRLKNSFRFGVYFLDPSKKPPVLGWCLHGPAYIVEVGLVPKSHLFIRRKKWWAQTPVINVRRVK